MAATMNANTETHVKEEEVPSVEDPAPAVPAAPEKEDSSAVAPPADAPADGSTGVAADVTDSAAPEDTNKVSEEKSPSPAPVRDESPDQDSQRESVSPDLELISKIKEATKKEDGKREKRSKKKEDKSIEHILKALNSLQTSEEKLAALCKKYTDLLEEHRVLQSKFKQNTKKMTVMTKEKEQLQTEHSKAVLAKSKLESLCRELQRHNKLVKEESLARAREEEEKRKEVTTKFQSTINDIQAQMNDHYAKNNKLREENVELANKLKSLIEQYELREQHIEKVFKHKDLEQQLVDAKLQQATLQMTEQKEKDVKEKQLYLKEAETAHQKIKQMETNEKQLRAQVALYTDKYEEFQKTLAKSNEVFTTFKGEMDKMTKKIKKLEKDTCMWKTRWENSNKALLDMAEEKAISDKEAAVLVGKNERLEKLCRALQAERNQKTNGASAEVESLLQVDSEILPTKTPPNTPSESRNSPETVQDGDKQNGDATAGVGEGQLDPIGEGAGQSEPNGDVTDQSELSAEGAGQSEPPTPSNGQSEAATDSHQSEAGDSVAPVVDEAAETLPSPPVEDGGAAGESQETAEVTPPTDLPPTVEPAAPQ